jgi:formylmethanofuran dehydrogenase subunit D
MPTTRLLLNPIRTAKQGVNVNVGKEGDEYKEIVTTLTLHPSDMESIGVGDGDLVVLRTEFGQAEFKCEQGKVPEGMIFVPYGPPTCKLMGGNTDGTGMPTSKGWEVDVEPVAKSDPTKGGD